jgi:heat shock protein HspQ
MSSVGALDYESLCNRGDILFGRGGDKTMTDIDYLEELMNSSNAGYGDVVNEYNFGIGDVVLDVDKSSNNSEIYESITDDNSQTFNEFVESNAFMNALNDDNAADTVHFTVPEMYSASDGAGRSVVVNCNSNNEINAQGADVETVLTVFSDRLAEAITLAAEGIR